MQPTTEDGTSGHHWTVGNRTRVAVKVGAFQFLVTHVPLEVSQLPLCQKYQCALKLSGTSTNTVLMIPRTPASATTYKTKCAVKAMQCWMHCTQCALFGITFFKSSVKKTTVHIGQSYFFLNSLLCGCCFHFYAHKKGSTNRCICVYCISDRVYCCHSFQDMLCAGAFQARKWRKVMRYAV